MSSGGRYVRPEHRYRHSYIIRRYTDSDGTGHYFQEFVPRTWVHERNDARVFFSRRAAENAGIKIYYSLEKLRLHAEIIAI